MKKCANCLQRGKWKYKRGKRNFCNLKCKKEYYDKHLPTQIRRTQIKFNKFITRNQRCAMCGRTYPQLQCSHVLSVGARDNLRFDIFNALPMDGRCHLWRWHENPLESTRWFKAKYPQRYNYLQFAKNQIKKWTVEELKEIRKAIDDKNTRKLIRFADEYAKS